MRERLLEYGWTKPLDESPFDLPDGWAGGSVQNTGGNIYCRIWIHEERQVEIIYGLGNGGIGMYNLRDDEEYGLINEGDEIHEISVHEASDELKSWVVEGLINNY